MKKLIAIIFVFSILACENNNLIHLRYADIVRPEGWTIFEEEYNSIALTDNIQGKAFLISIGYTERKDNYNLEELWAMIKPPYLKSENILDKKRVIINSNEWMMIENIDPKDKLHSLFSFTIVDGSIISSQYIAPENNYSVALPIYQKFLGDIKIKT